MTDIHTSHPADCTCPACRPEPAAGDIVLVPVPPRHGGRGRAAPTPCLVIDVTDEGGERRALLARGAPATGRPAKRGDVYAASADLGGASGLDRPHVFEASRPLPMSLGRVGIGAGARTTPVVPGRLGGRGRGRLEALRRRSPGAAGASI